MDKLLISKGFVHDGIQFTNANVLECIDDYDGYDFPKYRSGKYREISARQYVHRSGALFIRNIIDRQGWAILAGIENYRHASKENEFREIAGRIIREVSQLVTNDQ